MPGSADDARREAATEVLRSGQLTDEGRALLDRLLAEPHRFVEAGDPVHRPPPMSRVARALSLLPGGLVTGYFDADGIPHIDWVSPSLKVLLGLPDDTLDDGLELAKLLRVEDAEQVHDQTSAAALEQRDVRLDVRMTDLHGRTRWLRMVSVHEAPVGERYPFLTLASDVTGIRQTSEALVRSDAAFRAMLRGTRSAFALIDPDHRLLWFNDVAVRFAETMGWSAPEVGAMMFDIFDRDFYGYYLRAREGVLLGRTVERRMTFDTARGTTAILDVSLRPVRRPDDEVFAIGFSATDVTRQVEAEQAVVASDRVLARLPLGVALVDRRGMIEGWRAAAPEMFDLPPETAEGLSLVDLLVLEHEQRTWPLIEEALALGRELRVEVEGRRPDGTQIPLELTLSPIPDSRGQAVVVLEDVTARRALQRQVIESQKMEAVGIFAAGLAHDLNNLLAAIVGHTAMLDLDMQPEDPLREEVAGIERTTSRAATLVRSMLGLARQRSGSARTIDVPAVVRRARPLLERVAGTTCAIRVDMTVDTLPVRVDPVQLEQVLVNLVVNARDASPQGGSIRVSLDEVTLSRTEARSMSMMPGRVARLAVQDEGVGIPPGLVSRVFDPFFTTKSESHGTGLGLSICSQILRANGGEIRIQSEAGRGTRVTLWLPRSPDRPELVATEDGGSLVGGDERILLVEDVADLRSVWARLLGRLGYRVSTAADGVAALELLDRGEVYDMLVSDVVMPRVGGLAVARRFRTLRPQGPILMISAYPGSSFDTRSLDALSARLVRKPITGPALAQHIRSMLSSR